MNEHLKMHQYAPFPAELKELVESLQVYPGWEFRLADIERDPETTHGAAAGGLTFIVTTLTYNSYHPEHGRGYRVNHYFPVPAATYNREAWKRWLFEQLAKVSLHETMEFFQVEYERPFAPIHAPGHDPYTVVQLTTDEARRTSFKGEVKND